MSDFRCSNCLFIPFSFKFCTEFNLFCDMKNEVFLLFSVCFYGFISPFSCIFSSYLGIFCSRSGPMCSVLWSFSLDYSACFCLYFDLVSLPILLSFLPVSGVFTILFDQNLSVFPFIFSVSRPEFGLFLLSESLVPLPSSYLFLAFFDVFGLVFHHFCHSISRFSISKTSFQRFFDG